MPTTATSTSERFVQPSSTVVAWRFIAAADAPSPGEGDRRMSEPRDVVALREPVAELAPPVWPAPVDRFELATTAQLDEKLKTWMARPDHPQAVQTSTVRLDSTTVRWRPGRAVVEGEELRDAAAALVEFSFFEAELRRLEAAIAPFQLGAERDVPLSYDVRPGDGIRWDRLYRTMEEISGLRLQFARLEPCLYLANRTYSADARRLIRRLATAADIESRLAALNDRIESCEDLYEGAIDRITDHRNYRREHFLEITIVVLLLLEVVLLLIHRG
jgi:hypothetical protein